MQTARGLWQSAGQRRRSGTPVSSTRLPGSDRQRPAAGEHHRVTRIVVDQRDQLLRALHGGVEEGPSSSSGGQGIVAQQWAAG
jgi:hypothetical protein